MSALSAAPRGRVLAERQMTASCTVRGRSTGSTTNPSTGEVTETPGAVHYTGKCRIRPQGKSGASGGTQGSAGGAELFSFDYLVSVPFSATDAAEGDMVTIDASPDPALAGVTVEVTKVERGDTISARRLYCREAV